MPVVSVTRFKLRTGNPLGLGLFFWHTLKSARQAQAAKGFVGGRLLFDAGPTFWTVTIWESEGSMRAFRNHGNHRHAMRAMKVLDFFCSEAAVVTWSSLSSEIPDAGILLEKLVSEGRFYPLSRPSDAHVRRAPEKPAFRGGRILRPRAATNSVNTNSVK